MRKELFYNPRLLVERIAEWSIQRRRLKKITGTPAKRLNDSQLSSLEFLEIIENENQINTIFDVGANQGTWTLLAKSKFPTSTVYAFEPVPNYANEFEKNTRSLSGIHLMKLGIGNTTGQAMFNLAGHSSSFLEVGEELLRIHPDERKTGEIIVEVSTLDTVVKKLNSPYPELIKFDIEGFELEALKGAENCLKHAHYLILEVSFIERHKGQPLFADLIHYLAQKGFNLYAFPKKMHLGSPISSTDILLKKTVEG